MKLNKKMERVLTIICRVLIYAAILAGVVACVYGIKTGMSAIEIVVMCLGVSAVFLFVGILLVGIVTALIIIMKGV